METLKRISDKQFQKISVTETVFDITDLERQRDAIQNMLDADAQTKQERDFIISELEKTALTDEQKQRAIQGFVFSGTGATKSMLNEINKKIEDLNTLPVEIAIDVNIVQ